MPREARVRAVASRQRQPRRLAVKALVKAVVKVVVKVVAADKEARRRARVVREAAVVGQRRRVADQILPVSRVNIDSTSSSARRVV